MVREREEEEILGRMKKDRTMHLTEYPARYSVRFRLLLAALLGFPIGLAVFLRVTVPSWGVFAQFDQLSLVERLSFVLKLLLPLISWVLAGGWVWIVFWVISLWLSDHATHSKISPSHRKEWSGQIEFSPPLQVAIRRSESLAARPIAIPPCFQLDPAYPFQVMSFKSLPPSFIATPAANPLPGGNADEEEKGEQPEHQEEQTANDERTAGRASKQARPSSDEVLPQQNGSVPSNFSEAFSFDASSNLPQPAPLITISLLKRVQVRLHPPQGPAREVKLRRGENGIRLIVLAYIVWRKGKPVDRDKILTYVFARGKRRDMDVDQLSEAFDAAKKYLREDLKKTASAVNKEAGQELISEQAISFFQNEPGFYWLHPVCRVEDLECIEQLYQTIRIARKDGLLDEKLDGSISPWIIEACQQLLQAYPGDFLEELIEKFPDEFGSWVREPSTLYRDYYLDALWILAAYERALSCNFFDEHLSAEQNEERRRHHQGKAAQLYYDYALYAINSRVDSKLKFAYRAGKDGERVIMSQRAIRRCVVLLGMMGKTDAIDQVYLTYKDKMSLLSEGHWKPEKETESDVIEAKRQTNAYRFSAQHTTSPELPEQHTA